MAHAMRWTKQSLKRLLFSEVQARSPEVPAAEYSAPVSQVAVRDPPGIRCRRALVRNPHQVRAGRARARNAPRDEFGRFLPPRSTGTEASWRYRQRSPPASRAMHPSLHAVALATV
jgi:hypothetical protein